MAPRPNVRLADTDRIEGFSDAVFAIAITLLVLDLAIPRPGDFAADLLGDWPSYLAYLTAFVTIAGVWVHHHTVFTRVVRAEPVVVILNLLVLLGVSLIPWPTRLIGAALRDGRLSDQTAAVVVFAVPSVILAVAWFVLSRALAARPDLLGASDDVAFMQRNARTTVLTLVPTAAATGLAFVAPLGSLAIYLLISTYFVARNSQSTRPPAPGSVSAGDSD